MVVEANGKIALRRAVGWVGCNHIGGQAPKIMINLHTGYTSMRNEKNHLQQFNSSPYYIEDVSNLHYENEVDLTPIQEFYHEANVFITGSTGFLGKILVEKLLRSCPTVATLYLLVRNKKGKNLEERIDEMFDDVVFNRLKKECPKFRHKVVGVAGDCSLPELGLSLQDRRLLIDETNIVFHVAATVRFDEKIKTAVAINIRSPMDLLNIAKEMTKLKSFVHVSTIYGNCVETCIEERLYPAAIDGKKLILLSENLPEKILDDITPKLLGEYPNTYAFTKQIAEDIVKQESGNLPVGIFRPAIVISTYKEPVESWINNMYGPTGVVAGAGVGLLRTLHCNSKVNANLIPVDMCVNSLIASAWEVGKSFQEAVKEHKPYDILVYNYGSGTDQPLTWGRYMCLTSHYGVQFPSINSIWYYCLVLQKFYPLYLFYVFLLHTIPAALTDTVLFCMGKKPRLLTAYRKIHKFSAVISYFATREWIVKSENIRNQQNNMSEKDRAIFFSDLKQLDWIEFFKTYCRGIRMYLLQDPIETLDVAQIKWRRFYIAHQILKGATSLTLLWFSYCLIKMFIGRQL